MQNGAVARGLGTIRFDALGSQLVLSILSLASPIAILQIYDRVLTNGTSNTLMALVALLCAGLMLEFLVRLAQGFLRSSVGERFGHRTTVRLSASVLTGSRANDSELTPGGLMNDFRSIDKVKDFFHGGSVSAVAELPFCAIYLLLIFLIGGVLVLAPISVVILAAAWSLLARRAVLRQEKAQEDLERRTYDFAVETFMGVRTIKTLAIEHPMVRRLERLQHAAARGRSAMTCLSLDAATASSSFSLVAIVLVVSFGAYLAVTSGLSLGALAASTMLTGRIVPPVMKGLMTASRYHRIRDAEQFVRAIPEPPSAIARGPTLPRGPARIEFRHVTVAGSTHGADVLCEASHAFAPGEMTVVVSQRRDATTRLLRLINGAQPLIDGEVLIGDAPRDSINPDELGRRAAYVPADAVLFNATIRENVSCFHVAERFADARAILQALGAHKQITLLPSGYDTRVTADTQLLCRGVKQAIAIARAMVAKPSVLLLDEANRGMDLAADMKLAAFLKQLKGDVTVLFATDRPSYHRMADRIIAVRDGEIRDITRARKAHLERHTRVPKPVAFSVHDQIARAQGAIGAT